MLGLHLLDNLFDFSVVGSLTVGVEHKLVFGGFSVIIPVVS